MSQLGADLPFRPPAQGARVEVGDACLGAGQSQPSGGSHRVLEHSTEAGIVPSPRYGNAERAGRRVLLIGRED